MSRDLLRAREEAAATLQAAIGAVGRALWEFDRASAALGDDVARPLDSIIAMHFSAAGCGRFMAQKLVGKPGDLRSLVEHQHTRTSPTERR